MQFYTNMIYFDTETTGLNPWAKGFRVFSCQWGTEDGALHWCDEDTGFAGFLGAIRDTSELCAANASYDIHALRESGIVDLLETGHVVHDVLTLARVALPGRFAYGLKELGRDLLGADATKEQDALKAAAKEHGIPWTKENKDFYSLWRAEPSLMEEYGLQDITLTRQLWHKIWNKASPQAREVYRLETQVATILREAEKHGVLVDKGSLTDLEVRLEHERDELRGKLVHHGLSDAALGDGVKPASSKALLADLLGAGIPLHQLTAMSNKIVTRKDPATGRNVAVRDADGNARRRPAVLAVSKDALAEFADSNPVVGDLLAWRNRCKTLSTYVNALKLADPEIHPSFKQTEARTSRMSCAHPNLQNLPSTKGVREVLVPHPGNSFVVCDYDSIEVRVLAYYADNQELIDALETGLDLYSMNAAAVHGVPYETVIKGGASEHLRKMSKIAVLSLMYGSGAAKLGRTLNIPLEEAKALKQATLAAIPGYYPLAARIQAAVLSRGRQPYVETLTGRRLAIPRIAKLDAEGNKIDEDTATHVALNSVIQGSAAELMKLGMIAAAPRARELGYRVVMVVHDELVLEGPTSCAEEALAATIEAMEGCFPLKPRPKVSGSHSNDSYGSSK